MAEIDLDARIATAKAEAGVQVRPVLRWRSREWTVPQDMPLTFIDNVEKRSYLSALETMLGPDVRTLTPPVGIDEAVAVLEGIGESYGFEKSGE